jgi:flavin reductase (DIM6/NTAB) family NADH-FMN oxidoreductase RutF
VITNAVSAETFRDVMSSFPSGVAVVTTIGPDDEPFGITISSLCSLSLRPALLLVCLRSDSGTLDAIEFRGSFAVNLLHEDGQEAAIRFSSLTAHRFASVDWSRTPLWGLPALSGFAHATMECAVESLIPAGDHTMVVGRVEGATGDPAAAPLLYGLRRYASFPD